MNRTKCILSQRRAVGRKLLLVIALIAACRSEVDRHDPDPSSAGAVRRSSTQAWQSVTFPRARVNLEMPAEVCWKFDDEAGAAIQLHALSPSPAVAGDRVCMLKVSLHRMTRDSYAHRQAFLRALDDGTPSEKRWQWVAERSLSVRSLEEAGRRYFRYDVGCVDDEIIWAAADFPVGADRANDREDDVTVRRILESVRCHVVP